MTAITEVSQGVGELQRLALGNRPVNLGYECTEHVPTSQATHVVLTKRRQDEEKP